MKRFVFALALGLAAAAPAYAVTTSTGALDTPADPAGDFATGSYFENFNSYPQGSVASGFTGGAVQYKTVDVPGGDALYAQPSNDPTPYYSVGPSTTSPATLAIGGFNKLSFYWGSLDSYNTLTFLGLGKSFTGADFKGSAANGVSSYQVNFNFTPEEAALITGVQFASTSNAFEFDNLRIGSAVPEPSVWAMMMMGLGLVGAALRRRAGAVVGGVLGIA